MAAVGAAAITAARLQQGLTPPLFF